MKKETYFLIVGLGLLGGSYAQGLSAAGYEVDAIDLDEQNLQYAAQAGWIRQFSVEPDPALIQQADVLIFAVYPNTIVDWIRANQSWMKKDAILTDVTGVKRGIVETIQQFLRKDLEFIGAHPMAGKEVSGAKNSDSSLFHVANFIVTPTEKNTPRGIALAYDLAKTLGFAHLSELSLQQHDKMISFVSQLTHVIAVTLMNTHDNTHLAEYTGDSFRDLTRIAKINENLWTELFLLNQDYLLQDIDDFAAELQHFRKALAQGDSEEMKRLFRQSTQRRQQFDH